MAGSRLAPFLPLSLGSWPQLLMAPKGVGLLLQEGMLPSDSGCPGLDSALCFLPSPPLWEGHLLSPSPTNLLYSLLHLAFPQVRDA